MSRPKRPLADPRLRIAAVLSVAAARVGLQVLSVPRLRRLLRSLASGLRLPPQAVTPSAVGAAVLAAPRAVPRATCLVQALAAEALLHAAGRPAEVHLAASRTPRGGLAAHAWVTSQGVVVVGDGPGEHEPLASLPPVPGGPSPESPRGATHRTS